MYIYRKKVFETLWTFPVALSIAISQHQACPFPGWAQSIVTCATLFLPRHNSLTSSCLGHGSHPLVYSGSSTPRRLNTTPARSSIYVSFPMETRAPTENGLHPIWLHKNNTRTA